MDKHNSFTLTMTQVAEDAAKNFKQSGKGKTGGGMKDF